VSACFAVEEDDMDAVEQSLTLDQLSHSPPEQFKDRQQGIAMNIQRHLTYCGLSLCNHRLPAVSDVLKK